MEIGYHAVYHLKTITWGNKNIGVALPCGERA